VTRFWPVSIRALFRDISFIFNKLRRKSSNVGPVEKTPVSYKRPVFESCVNTSCCAGCDLDFFGASKKGHGRLDCGLTGGGGVIQRQNMNEPVARRITPSANAIEPERQAQLATHPTSASVNLTLEQENTEFKKTIDAQQKTIAAQQIQLAEYKRRLGES
jgi:hypothetical protein